MNQKTGNRINIKFFYNDQSGVFAILAAVLMPVILCFFALAIDVGHLMLVKSQLQNAADTAALSAADQFTTTGGWSDNKTKVAVVTAAQDTIGLNKSDGIPLTADNLISYAGTMNGFPAIKITINQTVHNWFGPIIGKYTSNVSATAVAVCQSCTDSGTTSLGFIFSRRINLSKNSESNQTRLHPYWYQHPPGLKKGDNITLTVRSWNFGWLSHWFQQSQQSQPSMYVSFQVTDVSPNNYGRRRGNDPTITGYFTSEISKNPPVSSGDPGSFKYAQLVN
jgi:hypothetical protein